jgi:hypothetical protein
MTLFCFAKYWQKDVEYDLETGPLSLDDRNKADALIGVINRFKMHVGPIGSWSHQAMVDLPRHNCLPSREPRAQSTGARKAEAAFRIAAERQCDIPSGSQHGARTRRPLVPHRVRLRSNNISGATGLRPPHFPEDRASRKQPRAVKVVPEYNRVAEAKTRFCEAADVGCNDQRRRAC